MICLWRLELVVIGEELPNVPSPWHVESALTLSARNHQIPFPVYFDVLLACFCGDLGHGDRSWMGGATRLPGMTCTRTVWGGHNVAYLLQHADCFRQLSLAWDGYMVLWDDYRMAPPTYYTSHTERLPIISLRRDLPWLMMGTLTSHESRVDETCTGNCCKALYGTPVERASDSMS